MKDLRVMARSRGVAPTVRDVWVMWLAMAAYAAVVALLLLELGGGRLRDPDTVGGIVGTGEAVLLTAYAFRRAVVVGAAATAGRVPPPSRPVVAVVAGLTLVTVLCALLSLVTG